MLFSKVAGKVFVILEAWIGTLRRRAFEGASVRFEVAAMCINTYDFRS